MQIERILGTRGNFSLVARYAAIKGLSLFKVRASGQDVPKNDHLRLLN